MSDEYTKRLVDRLVDESKWTSFAAGEGFTQLAKKVRSEVDADTVSGKIAHIFVRHQVLHEIIKELIQLSNLYVQGEIWPTVFEPAFDGGKDKMTGWYIDYYERHCIGCNNKDKFLEKAKRLNNLRNKVAHNLIGKNEVVINASFNEYERISQQTEKYVDACYNELHWKLADLNKRVDFAEFLD